MSELFGRLALASVLGLLLVFAARSAGGIIIYDENVQGDLPDPPLLFPLTPGDNEIFGSILAPTDPVDRFRVEIPFGFLIHDLDYDTTLPGIDLYELTPITSFDLPTVISGSGAPLTGNLLDLPPISGPPLTELDPGIWEIELKMEAPPDPSYALNFILIPIPEPGTLLLLGAGLAAMAASRRRTPR